MGALPENFSPVLSSEADPWRVALADRTAGHVARGSAGPPGVSPDQPDDPTWTLQLTAQGSRQQWRRLDTGEIAVAAGPAFNALPTLSEGAVVEALAATSAQPDLALHLRPLRYEVTWTVEIPPGWRADALPPAFDAAHGGVRAWSRWTQEPGRIVGSFGSEATAGPTRLTDVEATLEAIDHADVRGRWRFAIRLAGAKELAADPAALREVLARADAPGAPIEALAREAVVIHDLGFVPQGREACARLYAAHPEDLAAMECVRLTHGDALADGPGAASPEAQLRGRLAEYQRVPVWFARVMLLADATIARVWTHGADDPLVLEVVAALDKLVADKVMEDAWAARAHLAIARGRAPEVAASRPPTETATDLNPLIAALAVVGRVDEAAMRFVALPAEVRANAVIDVRASLLALREWQALRALLPKIVDHAADPAATRRVVAALRDTVRVDAPTGRPSPELAVRQVIDMAFGGSTQEQRRRWVVSSGPADDARLAERLEGASGLRRSARVAPSRTTSASRARGRCWRRTTPWPFMRR